MARENPQTFARLRSALLDDPRHSLQDDPHSTVACTQSDLIHSTGLLHSTALRYLPQKVT
jgi:hypothetical protein